MKQYKSGGTKPTQIGYMNHFRRVHSSTVAGFGEIKVDTDIYGNFEGFSTEQKVLLVPVGVVFHDLG